MKKLVSFVHNYANIQIEFYQFDGALRKANSEPGSLALSAYLCQSLPFLTCIARKIVGNIIDKSPYLVINDFEVDAWIERILYNFKNRNEKVLSAIYEELYSEET